MILALAVSCFAEPPVDVLLAGKIVPITWLRTASSAHGSSDPGARSERALRVSLVSWSSPFYGGAEGSVEIQTAAFAVCEIVTLRDWYQAEAVADADGRVEWRWHVRSMERGQYPLAIACRRNGDTVRIYPVGRIEQGPP